MSEDEWRRLGTKLQAYSSSEPIHPAAVDVLRTLGIVALRMADEAKIVEAPPVKLRMAP